MSTRITCPTCSVVLNVMDDAPARLTCPRCLSPLPNPHLSQSITALPVPPRPVISLESEIRHDLAGASMIIVILGALLIIGGVAAAWNSTSSTLSLWLIFAGIIIASIASIVFSFRRNSTRLRKVQSLAPPPRPGDVLEYLRPQDIDDTARTPFGWQAAAGFIAWVLGVGMVIAAARSAASNSQIFTFVIFGILTALIGLAIWLRIQFKWKGFLPGLLLGFGMTCLLPIGILIVICAR